jgi:hypothetical protein
MESTGPYHRNGLEMGWEFLPINHRKIIEKKLNGVKIMLDKLFGV